jgi:hypothetical protein
MQQSFQLGQNSPTGQNSSDFVGAFYKQIFGTPESRGTFFGKKFLEYGADLLSWPFQKAWNVASVPIGEISNFFDKEVLDSVGQMLDPEYAAYQTGRLISNDYIIDNLLQENALFRSKLRKTLIRLYLLNLLKMHNRKLEYNIDQLKKRLKLEHEVEEKISKLFEEPGT